MASHPDFAPNFSSYRGSVNFLPEPKFQGSLTGRFGSFCKREHSLDRLTAAWICSVGLFGSPLIFLVASGSWASEQKYGESSPPRLVVHYALCLWTAVMNSCTSPGYAQNEVGDQQLGALTWISVIQPAGLTPPRPWTVSPFR